MSELAYQYFAEADAYLSGDRVRRFERWLLSQRIPADLMRREVTAFRLMLDEAAVNAP
ncbi:hypothetical protein [Cohnella sp. 56]|uniref:hypothetical protein n=1 Tax=Cohnella sp. 56 TaxID=3113722 RepID=UPI0030E8EA2B